MKRVPGRHHTLGIRIRAHYTCAVAFVIMAAIVSTQLPESYSYWQKAVLGLATAAAFFVLLIVREVALDLASSRRHNQVKNVTLFAFGGLCHSTEHLILPNHELLTAAARLLSSLAAASLLYGLYALSIYTGNLTMAGVTEWLTFIWFSLFLLHLLPAFPLDAGMALRAVLLKRFHDYYRATHAATTVGWVAGLALIFGGVLVFIVTRQWLLGLVMIATGWCLQSASAVIRRESALVMSLEPTKVKDIMTGDYAAMDPRVTVGQLFREHILVSGWRHFVVTDGEALRGVLGPREIRSVPWRRRNSTQIGDIVTPSSEDKTARPGQSGADVFEAMDQLRVDGMPVLEDGRIVGFITRDRLVRLGKTRVEFGV